MKYLSVFFLVTFISVNVNSNELSKFACECSKSKIQIIENSNNFQKADCTNDWILSNNANFNKFIVSIYYNDEEKNIGNNWIGFDGTGSFDRITLSNYRKTDTELFFNYKYYAGENPITAINLDFVQNRYNLNSKLTISIKAKDKKNPDLYKIDFEKGLKTLVNEYNCTTDKIF